jgi:uncharacterized membrane protein YgdD (TMEM256/DUF423 family)
MAVHNRSMLFAGGLAGALGVAASAAAAHAGGPNLGSVAAILLAHAPALLALSLIRRPLAVAGGIVIMAGILLFCGDLVARDIFGQRLFPFAAPAGGVLMISGWLLVAVSAFGRGNAD